MKAPELAQILDLVPSRHRRHEWVAPRGEQTIGLLLGRAGHTLFVTHTIPLRAGLVIEERAALSSQPSSPRLPGVPDLPIPPALDRRLRVRASEREVARELVFAGERQLLALAPAGELAVDDQRAWLARAGVGSPDAERELIDRLAELSAVLVRARAEERAKFESEIAASWSEVAAALELTWSPERSVISSERRGLRLELRVDGEPGLLYTELYVEWPSLRRGLSIHRRGARGAIGPRPPEPDDELTRLFLQRHRALPEGPLARELMRGALAIGATGASLSADDTGLVARVDRVVHERSEVDALIRGGLAIATSLVAPSGGRGVYR